MSPPASQTPGLSESVWVLRSGSVYESGLASAYWLTYRLQSESVYQLVYRSRLELASAMM